MDELGDGIRRVTLPLPTRPGHVHAYLLPGEDGWTLVDTGVGLPEAKETWAELEQAGGRVATVFVTHFHPDHVGAAADLHELTGAPVVQGTLDYAQCELVWKPRVVGPAPRLVPAPRCARRRHGGARRPELRVSAVHPLPTGSDPRGGRRACRRLGARRRARPRRRAALPAARRRARRRGSPPRPHHAHGRLWPASLRSARRLPRRSTGRSSSHPGSPCPATGSRSRTPSVVRGSFQEHHRVRLEEAAAALTTEPQTGYELSFALFGSDLPPAGRRFAVAETLSHLERLVHRVRPAVTRSTERLPIPPDHRGRRLPAEYRRP